jgi:hypothetical protein
MGKVSGSSRSTSTWVSAGSSPSTSATRFCTCCSACTMSVPGANCAEISAEPRRVRERTRRMPGTSIAASSRGRVTVSAIGCGGSVPPCTRTRMRGNSSCG